MFFKLVQQIFWLMRYEGSFNYMVMSRSPLHQSSSTKSMAFTNPYQTYLKENEEFLSSKISTIEEYEEIPDSSSSSSDPSKGYVPKRHYYRDFKSLPKNEKVRLKKEKKAETSKSRQPLGDKGKEVDDQEKVCNCKQSNCLKKYCECYKFGDKCSRKCKCIDCKNKGKQVQPPKTAQVSCNCKKSECQKKYCECLNSGKKCTDLCNCLDCKNQPEINLKTFKPIKK